MKNTTILVVDDDEGITALLCDYLARHGFEALAAADGAAMRQRLAEQAVDLVVLDLMLPGEDGLALAHELRTGGRMPIIMLTARAAPSDRIVGLEVGADDYMAKPFDPRELVARIHSVLRRTATPPPDAAAASVLIRFAGWQLDRSERRLTSPGGHVVALSDAEFRLLCAFLRAPRRVCSRDQLSSEARGRERDAFERSIDLLVSRLRQKLLADPSAPPLIKTVRGAGYMLDVPPSSRQLAWQ